MTKLKVCFEVEGKEISDGLLLDKEMMKRAIMCDWDAVLGANPHARTVVRNLKVEEIE